jgi:hypothetical protein
MASDETANEVRQIKTSVGRTLSTILRRTQALLWASKFLALGLGISLIICVAHVQSQLLTGTPVGSPSQPKHRPEKRAEATPPVESAASPSTTEAPAAAPTPKRIRKKRTAELPASPTPAPVPVASPTPHKFKLRFPRLFKPRRSPSASPSA